MNISQALGELTGILHGTNTNQIQNINGVYFRAAREVLQDVDPNETKKVIQLPTVYPYIYDYPGIPDLKGNKIIDIAPQTPRLPSDVYLNTTPQSFDLSKSSNSAVGGVQDMFTIIWNQGVKTMRINTNQGQSPTTVSLADLATGSNGTWTGTNTTNLTTDYQNYFAGSGSLMFTANSGANPATCTLANSTLQSVDLSTYWGQNVIYLETYLPSPTNFTSVTLKIGSSASNYYTATVTTTQQATAFITGWNLLAFNTASMSKVGSPNNAAITYLAVTWTYNGTQMAGVRLNNIVSQIGFTLNCTYYSKYLFQNAQTLAFQETVTDLSNIINLDDDSVNLFLYKVAEMAVQQQQGLDALFYDASYFQGEYEKALTKYQTQYKSEVQKQQTTYYKQYGKGYDRYIGARGIRY